MKKPEYLVIPLLVLVVILVGIYTVNQPSAAPAPTPTNEQPAQSVISTTPAPTYASPEEVVQLAWFYKPPEEGQLGRVAQTFDFFILTYKDEAARAQLKSAGVATPFSQYMLFLIIEDPGDCDEGPHGNQVAYKEGDFCQISELYTDWFLLDENGKRIKSGSDTYHMDPGSEGYRAFWLERARELQETHGWDHIFLDNVEASRSKMVRDGRKLANYPDDESYQAAVMGFLDYIRQNYFEVREKKVYGNIVSLNEEQVFDDYLQHLDGVMVESFATDWDNGYRSPDEWEEQMLRVENALAQGKTLILVAQGEQGDLELQNFTFASYLLIANGNAVFRYTNSEAYRELWLYENYDLDIGKPLGDRYRDNDLWRRDFSNGYVTVNPATHEVEIVTTP
jgi:hypothetical protein